MDVLYPVSMCSLGGIIAIMANVYINYNKKFVRLCEKNLQVSRLIGVISILMQHDFFSSEFSDSDDGMSDADEVQEPKESSENLPNGK